MKLYSCKRSQAQAILSALLSAVPGTISQCMAGFFTGSFMLTLCIKMLEVARIDRIDSCQVITHLVPCLPESRDEPLPICLTMCAHVCVPLPRRYSTKCMSLEHLDRRTLSDTSASATVGFLPTYMLELSASFVVRPLPRSLPTHSVWQSFVRHWHAGAHEQPWSLACYCNLESASSPPRPL